MLACTRLCRIFGSRGTFSSRFSSQLLIPTAANLDRAAQALRTGGLVAFPTETVYGLGAAGLDETSVRRIFEAKGRPLTSPIILHVPSPAEALPLFDFRSSQAKKVFELLAARFWPGPLTLIHRASSVVPGIVTAQSGRVGVRCPDHPLATRFLALCGTPVAAPSANRFGHVSPTSWAHVMSDLGDKDVLILQGEATEGTGAAMHKEDQCKIGIESTVCAISENGLELTVLRCGFVTSEQIEEALRREGESQVRVEVAWASNSHQQLKTSSPGQADKHYAPDKSTFIVPRGTAPEALARQLELRTAFILDFAGSLAALRPLAAHYEDLSLSGSASEAFRELYPALRRSEEVKEATNVLLPDLSGLVSVQGRRDERLMALWDRLYRAASGRVVQSE